MAPDPIVDKYVLSPFPTLLAALALLVVFHDWHGEVAFVAWFVNFYFWYKRNRRTL
jgi:hypothetical protein